MSVTQVLAPLFATVQGVHQQGDLGGKSRQSDLGSGCPQGHLQHRAKRLLSGCFIKLMKKGISVNTHFHTSLLRCTPSRDRVLWPHYCPPPAGRITCWALGCQKRRCRSHQKLWLLAPWGICVGITATAFWHLLPCEAL